MTQHDLAQLDSALLRELSDQATATLVLSDGSVLWGQGIGAETRNIGEICFNTAMTGYQEILTDPSYAGQIICFTSVHIGNVGVNTDDNESLKPHTLGCILRNPITEPSNYRAEQNLDSWLRANNVPGIVGIDTRALTHRLRDEGALHAMLIHNPERNWNIPALAAEVADWAGLAGKDLAITVTTREAYQWNMGNWQSKGGYIQGAEAGSRVTVLDYGVKHMILRLLVEHNCVVTVVPATASFADIEATRPDGILLSNGPGDPAATGVYAVPVIQQILQAKIPLFGICLGHQMLALALGANTAKMSTGHHGTNHPVRDHHTGRTEITSQNHSFVVDTKSLDPEYQTCTSLFDGTISGLADPAGSFFSVQYHPEASPGPMDSAYLFDRFVGMLR
ncbi:MAG: glutamine-hydrolyzing carbamoyl-phosphate synthase small subunit [Alphaproteobacteria bacterium]|nr:glutamine-hydrolyzing carbamoyl-phosphate synthase small subunit [Alphaproteobacteria bacterium]